MSLLESRGVMIAGCVDVHAVYCRWGFGLLC